MQTRILAAVAAFALLLSLQALGEVKKKKASPPAETSAIVAGKQVKITYAAPSARGRKVFGELVPFGQVWRTGANAATSLTTDVDLEIHGLKVPKGNYTLYTLPAKDGMTLIINKQTGQWGTQYDESQDLGRVPMEVATTKAPVETLAITLKAEGKDSASLTIAWENEAAAVVLEAK